MPEADLRTLLLQYLGERNVVNLATTGLEGPWAAPVFYANQGFALYFVSNPTTRHGSDIGKGALVAAAITEDHRDWQAIQGIQLRGRCRPAELTEMTEAADTFLTKYPYARAFLDPAGPMYEKAGKKVIFYRLEITELWFTNNSRGFGHREHLVL